MKGDKGQKGDKGDRGDKGKNGGTITKFSIYTNLGPIANGSLGGGPTAPINSTARCDAGDTAISGSFRVLGSADIRIFEPLATEDGWFALALVSGNAAVPGNTGSVQADVVCFDNAKPFRSGIQGFSLGDLIGG